MRRMRRFARCGSAAAGRRLRDDWAALLDALAKVHAYADQMSSDLRMRQVWGAHAYTPRSPRHAHENRFEVLSRNRYDEIQRKKHSRASVATKRILLILVVSAVYLIAPGFLELDAGRATPFRLSADRPLVSCSLFAAGVGIDVAARKIRLAEIARGN